MAAPARPSGLRARELFWRRASLPRASLRQPGGQGKVSSCLPQAGRRPSRMTKGPPTSMIDRSFGPVRRRN